MAKEYTQIDFENSAKLVHGDIYDYSGDCYKDMYTDYNVICKIHGAFPIKPVYHIHGKKGCKLCREFLLIKERLKSLQEKAEKCHKGYYEVIDFVDSKSDVKAHCDIHGNYLTTKHMYVNTSYGGCDACKKLEMAEDFVLKAKNVHNDKYTYRIEDYISSRDEMRIFCNKHQTFFPQRPSAHLQGQGCPDCGKESASGKMTMSQQEFIQKCIDTHGDVDYDYSVTKYENNKVDCLFKCKIHGVFNMAPHNFISGNGCIDCYEQKRREFFKLQLIEKVSTNPLYRHFDLKSIVYVNNRTPVNVFCKDHEEWFEVTPNKLLDTTREVGCKTCGRLRWNRWSIKSLLKIPNIRKSTAYLYYGKVSGLDGFKLGITKDLQHRYSTYKRDMSQLDNTFNYLSVYRSDYFTCAVIEIVLKKLFSKRKIRHNLDFGGKHEIFDITHLDVIGDIFSGRFDLVFHNLSNIVVGNNDPQLLKFVDYLKKVYKIE